MLRVLILLSFPAWLVAILIFASLSAMGDARRDAQSLVRSKQGGLEGLARDGADLGTKVPGFESGSPRQTGYGDGQMADDAGLMMSDPQTSEGGAADAVRRAVARRPEHRDFDGTDPMFNRANRVQSNPNATLQGLLSGTYEGCAANLEGEGTGGEARFCDRYHSESQSQCSMGLTIDVQTNHNYRCHRERREFTRTCIRRAAVNWIDGQAQPRVTWTESCADSSS